MQPAYLTPATPAPTRIEELDPIGRAAAGDGVLVPARAPVELPAARLATGGWPEPPHPVPASATPARASASPR